MAIYFETLEQFHTSGGLKNTTITAKQLLPAVVAHMKRMDRKFTLQVNGRLPKSMTDLLDEVFELCHLQEPFYTQHCATRHSRYLNVSKSRVKIDFTLTYRMSRDEEKWVITEIQRVLKQITVDKMSNLEKVTAVHDFIIRNYGYEMNTTGSPFTVYTFMHEKQGVCMAYALLFAKMMDELGIPCFYVVGKADGESDLGHAWNMVQLDGEWYHIDATWDDLGSRTEKHEIRYRYFLRNDDFMKRDHHWNLEHYPICTSTKYEKLANLYDAALIKGKLYFPHPKTAALTMMDLTKLVMKKVQDIKVQHCTAFEGKLYFTNFSDNATLYYDDVTTHETKQLSSKQVKQIKCTEEKLTVMYLDGSEFVVEPIKNDATLPQQAEIIQYKTISLLELRDSWFGSYEGKAEPISFISDNGVKLHIVDELKQVTVDLTLHRSLELTITSSRKKVKFEKHAQLHIPKQLLVDKPSLLKLLTERASSSQDGTCFVLKIDGSMKLG